MTCAQASTAALASLLLMACGGETETPKSTPMPPRTAIPASSATADTQSPLLLPGKFRRDTTIADLQAQYGPGNVRIGDVPGPEGSTEPGAILFPDDPSRRAYVYFHDDMPHDGTQPRRLASVQVFDPQARWQLGHGVRMGMPFDALRRLNGRPFRFGGLGWDYGGYVSDWNGGTLAEHDGDQALIGVRLDARDQAQASDDTYPIGEGGYSSDDPAWPRMAAALVVSQLSISFPRDAE